MYYNRKKQAARLKGQQNTVGLISNHLLNPAPSHLTLTSVGESVVISAKADGL